MTIHIYASLARLPIAGEKAAWWILFVFVHGVKYSNINHGIFLSKHPAVSSLQSVKI